MTKTTSSTTVSPEILDKLNESSDFIFRYEDRNTVNGREPQWLLLPDLISTYIDGDLVPDGEVISDIYEVILRPAKHSDFLNVEGLISESKYIFYHESCAFDKRSEHYLNEEKKGVNLSEVRSSSFLNYETRANFLKPWHTPYGGIGGFKGNEILAEAIGKVLDDLGFEPPAVHVIEYEKEIKLKRVGQALIRID